MKSMDSKQLIAGVMDALAKGDRHPLFDAMAEDVSWRWMGVKDWSRTFEGKDQVINGLFGGVDDSLDASDSTTNVRGIYGDGDVVVVEHSGENRTPDGRTYNNNYCWVIGMRGDKIHEVREYLDTLLVEQTFNAGS